MAEVQPMAPKKGCRVCVSYTMLDRPIFWCSYPRRGAVFKVAGCLVWRVLGKELSGSTDGIYGTRKKRNVSNMFSQSSSRWQASSIDSGMKWLRGSGQIKSKPGTGHTSNL